MNSMFGISGGSGRLPALQIPDHELLSVIGEGSYGQVWMARNTIGTYRAVKVIRRDSFSEDGPFLREIEGIKKFEPVSRTHPGLVGILHVGQTQDGRCFYYIMELGDDIKSGPNIDPERYQVKTLASAVWDAGRLPVDRCVDVGLSLSDALAYLHSHDLLHRDVKPANIIFVAGYPKLADIGLVAETNSAKTYVGTEGFIPPEGPNSEQSDVFSLGKTLYEIATGQDRLEFPTLPVSIVQSDGKTNGKGGLLELIEIVNQACHHDRKVRYATARAMHAEITALANGRSIRRLRVLEKRLKIVNRALAIAGVILLPLIFAVYLLNQEWQRRSREIDREIGVFEANAAAQLADSEYARALVSVDKALNLAPKRLHNRSLQNRRASSILRVMPTLSHFWTTEGSVNALRFSSDELSLYVAGDRGFVGKFSLVDYTLKRFDGHLRDVRSLDLHEASGRLATAGLDQVVRIWDWVSGEELAAFHHPADLWAVAFSPDGGFMAAGGGAGPEQNAAFLWDLSDSSEPIARLPLGGGVRAISFSADGQSLAIAANSALFLYDLLAAQLSGPLQHDSQIYDVDFMTGDQRLLTASVDGRYGIWDRSSGSVNYLSQPQSFGLRAVDESPDGRFIATAGWDSSVRLWSESRGVLVPPVLRHSGRVNSIQFGPAGHRIATGASDGTVRVWDLAGQQLPHRVRGKWVATHAGYYASVDEGRVRLRKGNRELSLPEAHRKEEGGSQVLLTRTDPFLVSVEKRHGSHYRIGWSQLEPTNEAHQEIDVSLPSDLRYVDIAKSAGWFALGGERHFQVLNLKSGEALWPAKELEADAGRLLQLFFVPTRESLVVLAERQCLVLDVRTAKPRSAPFETGRELHFASVDAKGDTLVVAESDHGLEERSGYLLRFDDLPQPYAELRHRDGVLKAVFRPDGTEVVTASEDGTVMIWDVSSGEATGRQLVHDLAVEDVAFSIDGGLIVTASADETVRMWDADTGFPVMPPVRMPWTMEFGAIVPESNLILSQCTAATWTWTWDVAELAFPQGFLAKFGRLLSGDQLSARTRDVGVLDEWKEARALSPDLFEVTRSEIAAWHARQAFDVLVDQLKLPKGFQQEEFDQLVAADEFHYQRYEQISGEPDLWHLNYRKIVRRTIEAR